MKRTLMAALAALCCLAFLSGCSTMKDSWRGTKKWYHKYINTDPTIDLSNEGIADKGVQRLAALLMPVDERLMKMTRTLSCQDTPPEPDWPQQFLSSFSWLSGIAVLDTSGAVRSQVPAVALHPLKFEPLLDLADRYKKRELGVSVQHDEFGTVVMVAAPYFEHNEWTGLVVAFFDPRNLLRFSPDPDALIVLSSDGTLWPGAGNKGGEGVTGLKWEDLLKSSVQGEMTVGGGTLVWLARYLGQIHVIYLTDVQAARAAADAKKPEAPQPPAETPDTVKVPKAGAVKTPAETPSPSDAAGAPAKP